MSPPCVSALLNRPSWGLAKNVMSNGNRDKSSPELCLTMVITCPLLLLRCCCCCAAVADVLLLMCCCFLLLCCAAVVLLCVRVRGEIVGFAGKQTTAHAFAKDVSLIKNEGQEMEKLSRPRPAERQNEKASVFLPFGTRGTIRVCFFFCVFLPRAICALLSFLMQNRCFYPARPFASLATFLG